MRTVQSHPFSSSGLPDEINVQDADAFPPDSEPTTEEETRHYESWLKSQAFALDVALNGPQNAA